MLRNTRKTSLFLSFLLFPIVLFYACQSNQSNVENGPVEINLEILLGKWQAIDNPKNIIELTKNRMYAYHGDLRLSDESLMIYHNCVAKCLPEGTTQPLPCFVTDGKMAENCFKVLELSDKKLSYALIGNDEKVFKFQKM